MFLLCQETLKGYLHLLFHFLEEVMAQETTSRDSTSSPKDSADRIADASLNPAVVFTKNRYKFNSSSSHR